MDTLTERFAEFHRLHPDVKLHIQSGDADMVLERLDRGLADLGLLLGPVQQEKYDYRKLPQKETFGLLMPKDCELAKQRTVHLNQLKTLPLILAEQTFLGHRELEWFGSDYSSMNIVATYTLIYNATFLAERGVGYVLCLDRLVNTKGRNLTFRRKSTRYFRRR